MKKNNVPGKCRGSWPMLMIVFFAEFEIAFLPDQPIAHVAFAMRLRGKNVFK